MTHIFAIRHKSDNVFLSFNARCAWTKAGNAKNAWAKANMGYGKVFVTFDEQTDYELVELTDYFYRYEDLCK